MASQDESEIPPTQPEVSTPIGKGPPETPPRTPRKRPASAVASPKKPATPKASAKKLPKGKAEAKGKAQAKAKAKSVAKHTLKKPATSIPKTGKKTNKTEEEQDTSKKHQKPTLKRPASKHVDTSQVGKKSSSWRDGIKDQEEEEQKTDQEEPEEEKQDFEEDPVVEPKDSFARDRSKTHKFMQMLAAKQLPEFLQAEWNATLTMKSGKRDRQSLIINSLFDRSEAGKLLVNTDKPVFTAMKETYEDKFSKATQKSLTKRLFMGRFELTEDSLRDGVEEGEFLELKNDQGVTGYAWNEHSVTNKTGEKGAMSWNASSQGSTRDLAKFNQMTSNWKVGIPLKSLGASSASTTCKEPLALMDADAALSETHWQQAQKQMMQCQDALGKLEKEGLKHLQTIEHNKKDPVYEVLHLECK